MNIIPNKFAKKLVEENYAYISRFIIEHLDGPNKMEVLNQLNVNINLLEGDQSLPAGRCHIDKNYLNPTITLYEVGLVLDEHHFSWRGWTSKQVWLQVLFHELSHLVIALSDIEGNLPLFLSDKDESKGGQEEETLCNVMAERFMRRTGLLDNTAQHIYFAPEPLLQRGLFRERWKPYESFR